jgi:hypothetical protein
MRKRVYITLAVAVVILVGVVEWQALGPQQSDPLYQGRRLSVWLERYDYNAGRVTVIKAISMKETDEAIRQIGTNAIPLLLRRLRTRDSALKIWVMDLIRKQHFIRIKYIPARIQRLEGLMGVQALGPEARKAAVPLLLECLKNSDPTIRDYVGRALKEIDPEAVAKAGAK